MILIDFTFEINLFSLVAFLAGMLAGGIILSLLYLISCLTSLRKKTIKINKAIENLSEDDVKKIISKYQESFKDEKKRRKAIPFDHFKKEIYEMMNEIAGKFYPKSKKPLFELTLNEIILLDRYIVAKIEDLLSKRGLSLFKGLKVSTIMKIIEAKAIVDNHVVTKTVKKYRLKQIASVLSTALNFINPYMWFKKLIINPSINILTNKICLVCFAIVGEETYKVYSKQAFVEEDENLKTLLESIEKEGIVLENQVEEVIVNNKEK